MDFCDLKELATDGFPRALGQTNQVRQRFISASCDELSISWRPNFQHQSILAICISQDWTCVRKYSSIVCQGGPWKTGDCREDIQQEVLQKEGPSATAVSPHAHPYGSIISLRSIWMMTQLAEKSSTWSFIFQVEDSSPRLAALWLEVPGPFFSSVACPLRSSMVWLGSWWKSDGCKSAVKDELLSWKHQRLGRT